MSSPANPSAAEALAPVLTVPRAPGLPPTIPDYELLRRIGAGSYGEVWLARSTATGAWRAVKLVSRSTFTDARPFEREFEGILKFESLSRAHPSQLALFHVGRLEADHCFYYVMELADPASSGSSQDPPSEARSAPDGATSVSPSIVDVETYEPRTLRSDLESGRLPARRVLELGLALTEAVVHLHAHGLVHRDIKPSNIIFVRGHPKLADIGLVTDATTGDDRRSIVGTEGYLPPEGPGTPSADLFALSRVLYEALTGLDRRRFPELPADLRQWPDAALAFELNAILVRAGAADSRQRYPSAEAMKADLERLGAGKSVKRRLALRLGLRRLAVAAVIATVAALVFWAARPAPPKTDSSLGWTTNKPAAEAYYLGLFHSNSDLASSLGPARRYFEEAVRLDPGFADAENFLAFICRDEVANGLRHPLETWPEAERHMKRAQELTPQFTTMSRAHWMALIRHDWTGAEAEFRHIMMLEPGDDRRPPGLAYYVLLPQRRLEEARREVQTSIDAKPADRYYRLILALVLYYSGQYDEALKQCDLVDSLTPNLGRSRQTRAHVMMALGRSEKALPLYRQIVSENPELAWPKAFLFYAETVAGQKTPDSPTLEELLDHAEEPRMAYGLALAYAALGDKTKALNWLDVAYEQRDWDLLEIKCDFRMDSLRGEKKFHELLERMNLKP